MQCIFAKLTLCVGRDGAAYVGWGLGSVIWVLGFLYVSQKNIDSYASNLSRGVLLVVLNLRPHLKSDYSKIPPESIMCMIKRHLLLVMYGLVFAQCFFYLPINLVHTVSSSGPLFVLLIDFFLFRIEVSAQQILGIVVSSLGMLLAVNGDLLQKLIDPDYTFDSQFQNYRPESRNPYFQILVCLILILAEVGWAYSIVLVKHIKNATHYQLNFQYGLIMTMVAGCLYPNTRVPPQERLDSFLKSLVFQGFPLAVGQAFFSQSMTMTKNLGVMTMTGFIVVVIGYVVKLWRYEQPLNWICLCGSILVMLGISKIVLK